MLADDHALMRRSLRLLLDGEEDVEVVAEGGDLPAGRSATSTGTSPQVLVLDLNMPDGSSIEAIRRLRERAPDTQIVVMTMDENPVFAQRAFAAGAVGFVVKDRADGELPQAVRAAAAARSTSAHACAAGWTRCSARSTDDSSRCARSRCCG